MTGLSPNLSEADVTLFNKMTDEAHAQKTMSVQGAGESVFNSLPHDSPSVSRDHAYLDRLNPLVEAINGTARPAAVAALDLPAQLGPFNTGPISFAHGVPVGANASLTLRKDGSYSFSGHFHDSGATSYNTEFAWVIVDRTGRAYTFAHKGHTAGTFESGSRNDDWTSNGTNPAIAANWADLTASYHWRWQAACNFDIGSLINSIVTVIKAAGTVISTVIPIVAAL